MIAYQLTPEPDIVEAYDWLANAMAYDPVLLLASAYAWLDPILLEHDVSGDGIWNEDFESGVVAISEQTRKHAVDLYVNIVQLQHRTESEQKVYWAVNEMVSDYLGIHYFPDAIDYAISGYVAYECVGVDIENTDEFDAYDRLHPYVDLLGNDRAAHQTADILVKSLETTGDLVHHNIGTLLMLLYGHSGNTLFDWDGYGFGDSGIEPETWDNLDWAILVQAEANDMHDEAMAGVEALENDEWLMRALEYNARYVRTILEDEQTDGTFIVDLDWPEYLGDYRSGISDAQANLRILPFRPGPEERPDRIPH